MLEVQSVDISGLNTVLRGIQNALIGTGGDGDASKLVEQTCKLLAKDIADGVPPKNKEVLKKNIKRDVAKVFMAMPAKPFRGKQVGHGDIVWLYPTTHALVGVKQENLVLGQTNVTTLQRMMFDKKERVSKYSDVGQHGEQHVELVNRYVIKRDAYANLVRYLQGRAGRMKASLMKTYAALGGKNIPSWIAKWLNAAPGSYDKAGLSHADSPNMQFESHAPGIANQQIKVKQAISKRTAAMYKRLDLILRGYAKDIALTGKVSRHAMEGPDASA